MNNDTTSTVAGGGAAIALLLTVRWDAIPYGELIKVGMVVVLLAAGYVMYRGKNE
jgi:hypothetical protein